MTSSIQESPKSATLTWPGFAELPVPVEVRSGDHPLAVNVTTSGIADLPAPFNRASCWVYCREAWPHVDPDFEGDIFVTVVVEADHRYCQLMPNNTHSVTGVFQGSIITTDPLSLHWLAPNSDNGIDFVGLQYEVPFHKVDQFYAELLLELGQLGTVKINEPDFAGALLEAASEYAGAAPGPLSTAPRAQV